MQEPALTGERIVSELLDRVKGSAKVEVVFGEPREIGDKTIIPVAAVAYGFGAGAGTRAREEPGGDGSSRSGVGSGGGGGVRVHPIGVVEVTAAETRMVPIFDWTRIITTATIFLGLAMVIRALRGGGGSKARGR